MAHIAGRPDIQAKAWAELDRVVGRDRLPNEQDEKNLPSVAPLPFRHTPHFTHQVLHSIEDLIELRKLRRAREGIDVGKLNKGDLKKKKKKTEDDATTTTPTGLIKSGRQEVVDEEE